MHPFSNPLQFSDVFKGGRGGGRGGGGSVENRCIGNEWVNYKNKSQKNFNLLNEDYLPLSAILEQCI